MWDYDRQEEAFIVTNKSQYRPTIIQTKACDIYLRVLKHTTQIENLLKSKIKLPESYEKVIWHFLVTSEERLELAELAGVLMKFYGEPDQFYDDWKCSFHYTFDFKVSFKQDAPQKEVSLTMKIQDYKGCTEFQFRRPEESPEDRYGPY